VSAEVAALGADQPLELTAVEEDAVADGALVDRDAVALLGAHLAAALETDQVGGRVGHRLKVAP
jgi:hypothetical protein